VSAFLIRRMTPADVQAVALIDQMSFSLPWPPTAFQHELGTPHSRCWVAETRLDAPLDYPSPIPESLPSLSLQAGDLAIVAMLVLWKVVDEAHVATLAVHPRFRRRGIARQLLTRSLSAAAREGARSALLEVRASNAGAIRLYKELGFAEVGRRPRYYKDNNEDAVLMTLEALNPQTFQSAPHFAENP
jgi:ribosomal-protein-alanine N-acetyltransferase